ncbi:MAG: hypothetical protein ACIARR_07260 [Phycisphaerales bacterium JB059]
MQKRVLQLAPAMIALASFASIGNAGEIVSNGGFELGSGGDADGWNEISIFGGGAFASVLRSDLMPGAGDWGMRLEIAGASDFGPLAEAQHQTALNSVAAGQMFDFSVDLKREGALGPGVVMFLEVQWLDSDGSNGGGVVGSSGAIQIAGLLTESYQSFGFDDIVAANNADAALVILRLVGGALDGSDAVVYADNVSLRAVPAPSALGLGLAGLTLGARRRRRA